MSKLLSIGSVVAGASKSLRILLRVSSVAELGRKKLLKHFGPQFSSYLIGHPHASAGQGRQQSLLLLHDPLHLLIFQHYGAAGVVTVLTETWTTPATLRSMSGVKPFSNSLGIV